MGADGLKWKSTNNKLNSSAPVRQPRNGDVGCQRQRSSRNAGCQSGQRSHDGCHGAAVDARLIFLHRAHSRLILFENGLMTLDEAVFGLLADYCPCARRPA